MFTQQNHKNTKLSSLLFYVKSQTRLEKKRNEKRLYCWNDVGGMKEMTWHNLNSTATALCACGWNLSAGPGRSGLARTPCYWTNANVPYRTVWRDKVVVVQSCGCWAAAGADGDAQHSFVIFTLRGVRRGEEKKEEKKDIFKQILVSWEFWVELRWDRPRPAAAAAAAAGSSEDDGTAS